MSDENVVHLVPISVGEERHLEPDKLLEHWRGKLKEIVIIGRDDDDALVLVGSEGIGRTLWLMEKAKLQLLGE